MRTVFLSAIVMLTGFGPSLQSQSPAPFPYAGFVQERRHLDEIDRLLGESRPAEALALAKTLSCRGIQCRSKNLYIAMAHAKKGRYRPARAALARAMELGYELRYLDTLLFAPVLREIRKKYPVWRQRYRARIDTVLRTELIRMAGSDQQYRPAFAAARQQGDSARIRSLGRLIDSIDADNLNRLYRITEQSGWPGVQRVGHYEAGAPNPDPALVIVHSPEPDNLHFLEVISRACRQGAESWFAARTVMYNLLFRFATRDYPYVKLRHVFLDEQGRIDADRSLLQLDVLTDLLANNSWHDIALHPTSALTGADPSPLLLDLKRRLVALGCPEERILLDESPVPVQNDSLGTYYFCFRRIRK